MLVKPEQDLNCLKLEDNKFQMKLERKYHSQQKASVAVNLFTYKNLELNNKLSN